MTAITKDQAKKFLQAISKRDRIAIIHHDDGDGFCSAILLYDFLKPKAKKTETFHYNIGKTNLEKLPLEKFNKIIIVDVATETTKDQIKHIKRKQILYIDHHPKYSLPPRVKYLITNSKTYIPTSRTIYEIIKGKLFISLIGTISDSADLYKENQEFIEENLKKLDTSLEEFKKKYTYPLSNAIIYFKKNPKKIFKILSKLKGENNISKLKKYSKKVEKEIYKTIKKFQKEKETFGPITLFYYKSKLKISKPLINIVCKNSSEKIYIFLAPEKDKINISSRHQSPKANLPKLLETLTRNLPDSNSGGHPRASGGQIRKADLEKFKQNLRNYDLKAKG